MKVGIYTPYLETLAGGEKYMLSAAACLAKKHDVSLFWDPKHEATIKAGIKNRFGLEIPTIAFVENIFAPTYSFLTRIQESRKYDYILVLSDGSVPIVLSRLLLHFQTPMPWITPSVKLALKMRRVKKVICNSLYTKKYIDTEFGVDSMIIYPPVSVIKKDEKKENIILHVGRFGITNAGSSAKKQEFMEAAFKRMVDEGLTDWKMVFVISYKSDADEAVAAFKQSCKEYPITIIENPTNDQLWTTYNKAKIYWHASGIGEDLEKYPGRAEHFGISTVEAMGCGAVPIVVNAGGQPEIVEDGVNGFLWDSVESLISKTKKVIDDENLRKSLAEAAQKRAEVFSVETFAKSWESLIV